MAGSGSKSDRYFEARITVPSTIHDIVGIHIMENYADGITLEDDPQSEMMTITFYVPVGRGVGFREQLTSFINGLNSMPPVNPNAVMIMEVSSDTWETAFQEAITPIEIDGVVIRPPWGEELFPGKTEIIIEPKMAFGTGHHESTRLCMRAMLAGLKAGDRFFDLGCGSGILSILAAKLGAIKAVGVDIDDVAVDNARENVEINQVSDNVEIKQGSVAIAVATGPYDFLVANILKNVIVELFDSMCEAVRPGGTIVLAGLLEEEQEDLLNLIPRREDMKCYFRKEGEWIAVEVVIG
ncbi:MAG: 50S ribosomal protein L11 methyltransferase [candidate division Zixibacteria bacterium]|nr:50S ribosomal protein L11 methyltransferase [candidate division Zixibacteria bacterium]